MPWHIMENFDIGEWAELWTNEFLKIAHNNIPQRQVKIHPKDKYFMTTEIKQLLRKRNRLWKQWTRTHSEVHYNCFSLVRKEVKQAIKLSKHALDSKNFDKMNNQQCSSKDYWHLVKKVYGNKHKSSIPTMIEDKTMLSSALEKANLFNNHFTNKAKLPEVDKLPQISDMPVTPNKLLSSVPITEEIIENIVKSLPIRKANGPDNLSNQLLKEGIPAISKSLCSLFNASLMSGQVPQIWKQANVTPVFKGKGSKQDKSNYRPISLLSNVGKLLERIVFKAVHRFCVENGLLAWRNSGYKPKDSTINQPLVITHKIYQALENGHDYCFVSLDATAAFDRVWHQGWIYKFKKLVIC